MNIPHAGLRLAFLILAGTSVSGISAINPTFPYVAQKNDASDLSEIKKNALDLLDNRTAEGTAPGYYSSADRKTFRDAIEKAVTAEEISDAERIYREAVITVMISDDENDYWYYVVSGPSSSYCQDAALYDTSLSDGEQLKWNDLSVDSRCMWKFIDAGENGVFMVNKFSGRFVNNPGEVAEKVTAMSKQDDATSFYIESLGEQRAFAIRENVLNSVIFAYRDGTVVSAKNAAIGNSAVWHFDPVSADDLSDVDRTKDTWELVWSDEFDVEGPVNTEFWTFEKGFVRNSEPQWYQEDNAICKDGNLVISARKERVENPKYNPESSNWQLNREFAEYTSSSIISQHKADLKFGRMEVRAKIPVSSGAWPAIWAKGYPETNGSWPACGEIDILEYYKKSIFANVAWANEKGTAIWRTVQTPFSHFTDRDSEWADKYHIWALEWDEESIRLYLDDELLNVTAQSRTFQTVGDYCKDPYPFKTPMFILLNLALYAPDGIDESCFPLNYYVDYVRFFQKKDASSGIETPKADPKSEWILNINGTPYIDTEAFSGTIHIEVYDISGRLIYSGAVAQQSGAYPLTDLSKGLYIVSAKDDNGRRGKKIAVR